MGNSVGVLGFVWKCLEIFYLDEHNLGTAGGLSAEVKILWDVTNTLLKLRVNADQAAKRTSPFRAKSTAKESSLSHSSWVSAMASIGAKIS